MTVDCGAQFVLMKRVHSCEKLTSGRLPAEEEDLLLELFLLLQQALSCSPDVTCVLTQEITAKSPSVDDFWYPGDQKVDLTLFFPNEWKEKHHWSPKLFHLCDGYLVSAWGKALNKPPVRYITYQHIPVKVVFLISLQSKNVSGLKLPIWEALGETTRCLIPCHWIRLCSDNTVRKDHRSHESDVL